jgi:hypothetical protein
LFIYLFTKLVKLKIVFLMGKLEHFDYFRTDGLGNYKLLKKKKQSLMPAATPCSIANSITAAAGGNRT